MQWLDGTVALSRLLPCVTVAGLRLRRTFVFDYSRDGADRLQGFVVLTGRQVESVGLASDRQGF